MNEPRTITFATRHLRAVMDLFDTEPERETFRRGITEALLEWDWFISLEGSDDDE